MRQLYEAEVAEVDAAAGGVLEALDSMGLAASTLVVFFSDHGEEFWEHGGVEHGRTVYDEVVRVPLVMRLPGRIEAGGTAHSLVRLTDVAPTVLGLLGWPVPADLDGVDVLPAAGTAAAEEERVALIEFMHFAEERVGLRTASRKYVRWEIGKEEVYDLIRDPGELVDLAGVEAEVAPLRAAYARLDGSRKPPPSGQTMPPASGAAREALRALGYLE
jgi:arylsulfatase A-like enzyme